MASRDRFKLNITCPKCSQKGKADVSEDDHPYMKPHGHFSIDRVSKGFTVTCHLGFDEAEIRCDCGYNFQPQQRLRE